ncbi:ACT domain-containing protein, partial [Pseudomonas syringae pv. actinidiae]|nr:ACT domain-containing protein [Pseudomonas syringae pv. actinidiae]
AFAPQVTIHNDAQRPVTVLELLAPDRPGLLARIGKIFLEFDLSLQNARLQPSGERVKHVFFITDANNQPLSDPQLCSLLQEAIVKQLSVNSEPGGDLRISI